MKSFYDYMEEDPIAKIEYSKGLYNDQVHKVEKEEYIKNKLEVIRKEYSWEKLVDEHEKYFQWMMEQKL